MIHQLFAHITTKVLSMLEKDRQFFTRSEEERMKHLDAEKLPASFKEYLKTVSEEAFLKDLMSTFKLIKHLDEKSSRIGVNRGFSSALAGYIMNEVGTLFDRIPMDFYGMTVTQKKAFLEDKAKLPPIFVHSLSSMTYQENFESLFQFLKVVDPETPYIVVQMARDTESETKKEMRDSFKAKYKSAFPLFQVSKHLYGGVKLFVDGKVTDESWRGKIERFASQI